MGIGRLGSGRAEYYLAQVADGVEDYYSEGGEAAGVWLGVGTPALGLSGNVEADDLRAVLSGQGPDGSAIARASRKTPGFDVTFRAPKSVSLLYALGEPEVRAKVRAGHEEAVRQVVGYLERVACFTRRGPQGRETIRGHGFVAAGFLHRTSRAGDPQLHTHVLIANSVLGIDGRWSALDARHLFRQTGTAGRLYQAALRAELTTRLGVQWQPTRHGYTDLEGVDRHVVQAFSTRRREILDVLDRRGEFSARSAQVAALDTRPTKPDGTWNELQARWRRTADALGFDNQAVSKVVDRVRRHTPLVDARVSPSELVGPSGLTGRRSSFDRQDVLEAWCQQLPEGAAIVDIEAMTDRLLESDGVVRLGGSAAAAAWERSFRRDDGQHMPAPSNLPRYTTPEMQAVERRLVADAEGRTDAEVAAADPDLVETAIALRPTLTAEQRDVIRTLTTSGDGVAVVVGKAGAGKTFALDTCRTAWQVSHIPVIGCALSARAAAELQDTAGIPSTTIHRLLDEMAQQPLPHGCVLVVDEAAMVGTRTLALLAEKAAAVDGKLVLVGDDHQLPAIDAGGGFRALTQTLTPCTLDDNRRQREPWERQALNQLRHGHTRPALDAYRREGRITLAASTEDARQLLVYDWHRSGHAGPMIALHRRDVDDLNQRARRALHENGQLEGPDLEIGGRAFAVGDQVIGRRNDYRTGLLNGTRGTVVATHPAERTVTIAFADNGQHVRLPRSYLAAGHLDHAYAITVHKAQGATFDQAFVLGSDRLYREAGYVALSRARDTTRLYTVGDVTDEHRTHDIDADLLRPLTAALGRSRAEPSIRELDPRRRGDGVSL